ncbi:hypothetical protein B4129_0722 [Bacillus safensis]|nr:hypothetical protein B4129_0722 [Bacillus safensis]
MRHTAAKRIVPFRLDMLSSPFVDLHYKEKNSKSVIIFQK